MTEDTTTKTPAEETKSLTLPEKIVIKDFAELLGKSVTDVMSELMKNGIMSNLNERIDYDTARIIAEDMGFSVSEEVGEEQKTRQDKELAELLEQDTKNTQNQLRPPVVVVMGHVDHGKTALLDAIRKTDVAAKESGGITQHIGAYQVEEKGRPITFIDTPGHEAFTAMRSRGARVADVAILVVAADDGIQQQTMEAIEIIHRADLSFVVAINKIDKDGADVERVKKELSDENLVPEEWGGKVVVTPVSAKNGEGITDLLDTVLLVADLEKEYLQADPKRPAVGTVIESHVDKGEGPVATVVVQTGTLATGDLILVGDVGGKVKALKDHLGKTVTTAGPSTPVRILGLKGIPQVGDVLKVADDKRLLREQMKTARTQKQQDTVAVSVPAPDSSDEDENEGPKKPMLPVLLKADNLGSLEALTAALESFEHDDIGLRIVAKGLGNVTEGDVARAHATKAGIYAFNVKELPAAIEVAKEQNVSVQTFTVIYELLSVIEEQLNTLLSPEMIRTDLGKMKVLAVFRTEKTQMIIGGKVVSGTVRNKMPFDLYRGATVVGHGTIQQLQSKKQDADEVSQGHECGMKVRTDVKITEGDELQVYSEESKAREVKLSKPRR